MPVIVAVLVALLASSVVAGEAAVMCRYSDLARVVDVTAAQARAMERILAELDGKLKRWDAANRAKIAAFDAKLATARKSSDMKVMCEILNRKQALQAERAALAGPYMAKLVAQLNADQRGLWEGHMLFRQMYRAFSPFRLTTTQLDDIRTRCVEPGKAIAALRVTGKADEIAKVRTALRRDIVQDVLTTKQLERFAGSAKAHASGPKETPAQRAERIRLAAMGFADRRLAEAMKGSARAINAAVNNAAAAAENMRTTSGGSSSGGTQGSSRGSTRRASSGSGGCPPAAST